MTPIYKQTRLALALVAFGGAACNFDIANPNSPEIIGENPNRSQVAASSIGLLIATRADVADWALDAALLGREAYRFDGSDPRFTGELMQGPLDPGSRAFGGDHWAEQYAAIRSANNLLAVIGTASELTAEEQNAVRGYAHTLQAYNFMIVLDAHTQDAIPIDVGTDVTAPPAPLVTNAEAWTHVMQLLDNAVPELQAAGTSAFPFDLPPGFTGFDTPSTFILFNRALRARVAVYRADYTGALTFLSQSFLNPAAPMELGVYMDYSAGAGDLPNPLALDPQVGENFGNPLLRTQAQLQADGVSLDQRFLTKLTPRPQRSAGTPQVLTSDLGWVRYPSPNSPIPLIKNEELILLRAEANINLSNFVPAVEDLNLVRQTSGLLGPYVGPVDQPSLINELLYNKRYSLMYEGGHSWIDYRRYGLTAALQSLDRPGPPPDVIFPTLPIPTAETQPRS
ncbi:MAG TPA: RagB/SusD family nutrient uptake outer membrane protein [Gemmatimonadales bacterium]|nr:RagB/SusD family nutrient uptake outer membrane protein [Gemmatimonadales bacterium]